MSHLMLPTFMISADLWDFCLRRPLKVWPLADTAPVQPFPFLLSMRLALTGLHSFPTSDWAASGSASLLGAALSSAHALLSIQDPARFMALIYVDIGKIHNNSALSCDSLADSKTMTPLRFLNTHCHWLNAPIWRHKISWATWYQKRMMVCMRHAMCLKFTIVVCCTDLHFCYVVPALRPPTWYLSPVEPPVVMN